MPANARQPNLKTATREPTVASGAKRRNTQSTMLPFWNAIKVKFVDKGVREEVPTSPAPEVPDTRYCLLMIEWG